MCAVCGCGSRGEKHAHGHDHEHHDHAHEHSHGHETHTHQGDHHGADADAESRRLLVEAQILSQNQRRADENRNWLRSRRTVALNLVGAPGSGKTTLLERTIDFLFPEIPIAVLEGDQETEMDAERIRELGVPVQQINTGSGCHLNASMIGERLESLGPPEGSLLFIENVGNLVCPALFDVGERAKVTVLSITEGEEKPLKYPQIVRASEALVLNKIDLLPHLDFDLQRCLENVRKVHPSIRIFPASTKTGIGLDDFYEWLRALLTEAGEAAQAAEVRR